MKTNNSKTKIMQTASNIAEKVMMVGIILQFILIAVSIVLFAIEFGNSVIGVIFTIFFITAFATCAWIWMDVFKSIFELKKSEDS